MTTLRTILCPIDFSDQSRHALRWAEALAGRHRSRLIVLTAVDPLLAEAAKVRLGLDLATTEVEPALREFVRTTWRDETRARDAVFHVRVGDPADVILDAAAGGVDLVVIGTHGLGGFRKWLLGSTTQRVLRRTRTPVLAVPAVISEPATPDVTDAQVNGAVLAASDLSDASVHAMRWAARFATACDVPLLLAHVVEPVVVAPQWRPYVQETDDARVAAARERLKQFAQQICSGPCETIVSLGRPDDAIASIAAERKAGLIVMGLGSGPGFLVPRPGSIAYRVLCVATAPVLVVPPEPLAP
jgi:nucleotide-binding universal stress UspA family protein